MIAYFPVPYPDEIFYSLIARLCKHSSAERPKELLEELFGTANATATLDLPSHLDVFHIRIKKIFNKTVEDLIKDHTLLPYYASFISQIKLENIKLSMAGRSGNIHTRIGINAGINSALTLPRYCPICFGEDKLKYGEAYWHRSHQIPSFNYCHIHYCQLYEAKAGFETMNKHFYIPPDERYCFNKQIYDNKNKQINDIICKAVTFLYVNTQFNNKPNYYRETLAKIGFAKSNFRIEQNKLFQAFTSFYYKETLIYFKSEVQYSSQNCWLKTISRKVRKSIDPIRHALLEYFIQNYNASLSSSEFSSGPWICLNPVCSSYNLAVIEHIDIKYDTKSKKKIGYLACKCGFTYTLSYLEKQKKFFYRVKSYGLVWTEKLQQLLKDNLSLRKISTILHSDPKTVKLQIRKNQNDFSIDTNQFSDILKIRRNQWLVLVNSYRKKSIKELRNNSPALYMWLYRNDKEWISKIRYHKSNNKSKNERVNWTEKDKQYVEALKLSYQKIIFSKKTRWISKTMLIKLTDPKSTLEKHLNKLPLSKEFIEAVIETKEAFRIRKIHASKLLLVQAGEKVERWKLLRLAGIRKEYVSQKIENEILDILTC